jgi:signal transduction histidine kinase
VLRRTWPLLVFTFGLLLATFVLSGLVLFRDYRRIYAEVEQTQRSYQGTERLLDVIRSEVYSVAILVRDYLLKSSPTADRQEQNELANITTSLLKHVSELRSVLDAAEQPRMQDLHTHISRYSALVANMFEWSPDERRSRSYAFLTREIVPFRDAVLTITGEIDRLNSLQFERRLEAMRDLQGQAERHMIWAVAFVSVFGVLVAGLVVGRTRDLEHRSDRHQAEIEHEREELRRLSNKVVSAQEEERKAISRELHDEIGQLLTGLKIELLHMEVTRESRGDAFPEHLARARGMAEQTLRAVRDLATGLRPAVLDQLGLEPAIRSQAREHTKLTSTPVTVEVEGELDGLPEAHRTCAYRAVQEALTNCARHAHPRSIAVRIHGTGSTLRLKVHDDGGGFTTGARNGVGLLGMQERVAELRGTMSVSSCPESGTTIDIEIPLNQESRS